MQSHGYYNMQRTCGKTFFEENTIVFYKELIAEMYILMHITKNLDLYIEALLSPHWN